MSGNKSGQLGRNAAVYGGALLLPRLAAFVALIVFSRLLTPAEYGYFALFVISAELMNMVLFNWIRLAFLRLYPEHEAQGRLSPAAADMSGNDGCGHGSCRCPWRWDGPAGDARSLVRLRRPVGQHELRQRRCAPSPLGASGRGTLARLFLDRGRARGTVARHQSRPRRSHGCAFRGAKHRLHRRQCGRGACLPGAVRPRLDAALARSGLGEVDHLLCGPHRADHGA